MQTTFDVQRDHAALISKAAALLADAGTLVFSTNKRKFEFDVAGLHRSGLEARDITAQTIPKDFERRLPHHCFFIERA